MYLPESVLCCIRTLQDSGFEAYAVGGCVRDALLGLTPHDYDLCTNAAPEDICRVFADLPQVHSGQKHGTVGVIIDHTLCEITTFRTEGDYRDNRRPGWVKFVDTVEEDLARRDFTVNAMAYSPETGYIDPWGGRQDLQEGILRAVGDAATRFSEDALRILRGVRFAVRFGLTPERETEQAMHDLAPAMEHLARERVFDELCKLIVLVNAKDLQQLAPVLTQVIPELEPMVGFDQRSPHHAYDLFTHTAYVTEGVPPLLHLRWAALLHDTGKIPTFTTDETGRGHFYGHAKESAVIAEQVLRRLKAPTALREQVVDLIGQHMTKIEPEKRAVRRRLSKLGPEMLDALLVLQEADMGSKGTGDPREKEQFPQIREILNQIQQENACFSLKDLAVNGHDLMALGIAGRKIGETLHRLLEQVIDEKLPNEKDALLGAVKEEESL